MYCTTRGAFTFSAGGISDRISHPKKWGSTVLRCWTTGYIAACTLLLAILPARADPVQEDRDIILRTVQWSAADPSGMRTIALTTAIDRIKNSKASAQTVAANEARAAFLALAEPVQTRAQLIDILGSQQALARAVLLQQKPVSLTTLAGNLTEAIGRRSPRVPSPFHSVLNTLPPTSVLPSAGEAAARVAAVYRAGEKFNPREIKELYEGAQTELRNEIVSQTDRGAISRQQLANWQQSAALLSVFAAQSGSVELQKAANVIQSGVQLYAAAGAILAVSTGWGAVLALPALLQSGQTFASAFGGQNQEDGSAIILKVLVPMLEKISRQIEGIDRKLDLLLIDVGQLAQDVAAGRERLDSITQKLATVSESLRTQDRIFEVAQKNMVRELQGMSVDGCLRVRTPHIEPDRFNACLDAFARIARTSASYPHQAPSLTIEDAYDTIVERLTVERGTAVSMPVGHDWLEALRVVLSTDLANTFDIPSAPLPNPSVLYGAIKGYAALASQHPQNWQLQSSEAVREEIEELKELASRYAIFADGIGAAKRHRSFQENGSTKTIREVLIQNYIKAAETMRETIVKRAEAILKSELDKRTNRKAASEVLSLTLHQCLPSGKKTGRKEVLDKGPNIPLDAAYLLQIEDTENTRAPLLPLTICSDVSIVDKNEFHLFDATPTRPFSDLQGCGRFRDRYPTSLTSHPRFNPHLLFHFSVKYKIFLGDREVVAGEWRGDGWSAAYYLCHNSKGAFDTYLGNDAWGLFFVSNDWHRPLAQDLKRTIIEAANAKAGEVKKLLDQGVRDHLLGALLSEILPEEMENKGTGIGAAVRQLDRSIAALRGYAILAMQDVMLREKGWAEVLFGNGFTSLFTSARLRKWTACASEPDAAEGRPVCAAEFRASADSKLKSPGTILNGLNDSANALRYLSSNFADDRSDGASAADNVVFRLEVAKASVQSLSPP